MVVDDMFRRSTRGDSDWAVRLKMTTNEWQQARAKGENGWRDAFDKWLNAGHTLGDFVAILHNMEARVLGSDLGLIDLPGRAAQVTLSRQSKPAKKSKLIVEDWADDNLLTTMSIVGPSAPLKAPQASSSGCAFAPVDEDAVPEEPTLGQLVLSDRRARSFTRLLIAMSEDELWYAWLAYEGLTRGVAAERFVANVTSELERDPDFDAMDHVLRELVKLKKYRDLTRSEFIESLKRTKNAQIVSAVEKWSTALTTIISTAEEPVDHAKEAHEEQATLRAFFKNNKVFRGQSAASRLDRTLNTLSSDSIGIYEPADFKDLPFETVQGFGVFNVSETRKVVAAAKALK